MTIPALVIAGVVLVLVLNRKPEVVAKNQKSPLTEKSRAVAVARPDPPLQAEPRQPPSQAEPKKDSPPVEQKPKKDELVIPPSKPRSLLPDPLPAPIEPPKVPDLTPKRAPETKPKQDADPENWEREPTQPISPDVRRIIASLGRASDSNSHRNGAAELIKLKESGKQATTALIGCIMYETDERAKTTEIEALKAINPRLSELVITVAFDDKSEHIVEALQSLGVLGKEARPAVGLLVFLKQKLIVSKPKAPNRLRIPNTNTHNDSPTPDSAVVDALGVIAADNARLTKRFINWLANEHDATARVAILKALPSMAEGEQYLKEIAAVLRRDPDDKVRLAAVQSLGEFGNKAKKVEDAIKAAWTDRSKDVREAAKLAIERVSQTPSP
jgi:hypothetical protein